MRDPLALTMRGLDLLMDNFAKEGFQVVPTSGISTPRKRRWPFIFYLREQNQPRWRLHWFWLFCTSPI